MIDTKLIRRKILDLAIRGKLVPQAPSDEPASELLKRINAEKAVLVKSGKIKKEKPLPPISESEIPFDIPDNWNVLRIGDCLELVNGRAYKQSELLNSGKYRVLRVGNFFTNSSWYYSDLELPDDKYCYCGDLLYAWSASFGPRIWDGEKTIFHYHIWNVKFDECLFDKKYLYYFLLWDKERLEESKTGSTMVHVSMEHMKPRLIFIPPLAEQARIVEKVEALMNEVDTIERETENLNRTFALTREKVLDLAIRGKLVPQDPNDEPASELLKRIQAEKIALIKSGKLKKEKPLPPISESEIPFPIPPSWSWTRLGDVCFIARGGSPRPIKEFLTDDPNGINWIKIGDSDKGGKYINSTKERIIPSGVSKSRMVHAGDFLLTNSMSFGRPYILNVDGCIHDGWLVLSNYQAVYDKDFLYYMLSSGFAYQQFIGVTSGSVVKNLNSDKVADTHFPLPPLAEQKRIVKKLETILSTLDVQQ